MATLAVFTAEQLQEPDLDTVLRFETGGDSLLGWGGGPPGTLHLDRSVVHSGRGAARLERDSGSPGEFSTITKQLPIEFDGRWIELRGFLRTDGVSGFAGLWLREDGPSGVVQFDNMQAKGLRGTTGWAEYSVRLPLDADARHLFFGVLVAGEGKVWADDLRLLVDEKPLADAPTRVVAPTVLDTDHEFDRGSGVTVRSLTTSQIEHVAVLGAVWGFLKYHHPRIRGGELHWDYELFRVLPGILGADSIEARNRILADWVGRLGVPEPCEPCAGLPEGAHRQPRLDWIHDAGSLGTVLSGRLEQIYARRSRRQEQFYVSQAPGVGNPLFERELAYQGMTPPDAGFRILALLRVWNVIEYWYPYRDLIDGDWAMVLREFLPRIVEAASWDDYRLELQAFVARVQDTHAGVSPVADVIPPRGGCSLPVAVRFVERRATIVALTDRARAPATGLEPGDVIESVDGRAVDGLVEAWSAYYGASNEAARLRAIASSIPRGNCGSSSLTVDRAGSRRTVVVPRTGGASVAPRWHDRPGDTFQLLSSDVAYLKLSSVRVQDLGGYFERAAGTRGLVIDIRNYPSEFVVFHLGGRLVDQVTPFARFTVADLGNPGAFVWTPPVALQPIAPRYPGKIVILVDESSLSQAEYTAMAFRAAPGAVVVGSTTAGADGNVSRIPLPGGLSASITGIGVFYPDKRPTQQIGILPDRVVVPTVAGIRAGRDEVLEEAIRQILGSSVDEGKLRELAGRR